MTLNKFNLPDVGEGLTEAEIVSWKVKPGDTVAINDVLCEIETAKSLVELPSPFAGTVTELLVPEGVTVDVGTAIISVSDAVSGDPTPADVPLPALQESEPEPLLYGKLHQHQHTGPTASDGGAAAGGLAGGPLVGSGPKADPVTRRPRKASTAAGGQGEAGVSVGSIPGGGEAGMSAGSITGQGGPGVSAASIGGLEKPTLGGAITGLVNKVLAKPPVRKIARDLGIDLADVTPTGARGEVTREDLVSYQAQRDAELDKADTFWGKSGRPQEQRIERIPVKGVRKATAKAMVDSAFSAPHVSIFVDVDASRTMEFVKRLKASRDFEGIRVSPLLILAKAVIWAAARNPSVNATWVDNPGGDLDSTVVSLSRFHVEIGDQPLDAAFTLRTPVSDPAIEARVEGTLDLNAVARTVKLGPEREVGGVVVADASMRARRSDVDSARYFDESLLSILADGDPGLLGDAAPRDDR